MSGLLHFEDFPPGEEVTFGGREVTAGEIKAFAAEFDPQPFHLDEAAAVHSLAGALSASGWHTIAMTMRMMVDAYLSNAASMGSFGIEEAKWLKPVFAGDILTCTRRTLDARISARRPEMGILRIEWTVRDQHGTAKLLLRGSQLIKVRGAAS